MSFGYGTTVTYTFDVVGNITEKSDTGAPYLYTTSKVHAVTEITVGGTTKNLSYDANGNLSSGDDVPTITWSSYNKPTQLTKGAITYNFSYGPDRSRYKKVKGTDTTYYIGSGFERINKFSSTEYRHMIRANGKVVMIRKDFSAGVMNHQYVHRDHLGSVTALTKESDGSVIERYSYDAWGMRRNPTTWAAATITAYEPRGYTGHEHLDDIGVIHMNGRVYDPKLGRMLSPDPVTQAPENGQNYNRYTYAYNNPLKYTDPSGYISVGCSPSDELDGFTCGLVADDPGAPSQDVKGPIGVTGTTVVNGVLVPRYTALVVTTLAAQARVGALQLGDMVSFGIVVASPRVVGTQSVPITAKEMKLATQGKYKKFWRSRYAAGDPVAKVALAGWDPKFKGATQIEKANAKATWALLELYIKVSGTDTTMKNIAKDLALSHAVAVSQDTDNVHNLLSPEQVATYHALVFAKHEIPSALFGGTLGNLPAGTYDQLWCQGCDENQ